MNCPVCHQAMLSEWPHTHSSAGFTTTPTTRRYLDLSDPATVERLARKADEIGLGAFWIESPSEPQEGDFPSTTMTFDFDAWAAAIIAALREER